MHMSDALISPVVGGAMIAISVAATFYCVKKVNTDLHIDEGERKIPLMGILGAFIFAAQMINFTIPMTGSSGHLAGALLLCALLGPYAGFLVMACVLVIQALFFADGGLLALGCNIFNMGFYTCFIVYPLLYKKIVKQNTGMTKITIASILSAIIGLQLGAFSVVIETLLSGKTELPFLAFVAFMQPIHLAIGVVEGAVTATILCFVYKAMPQILDVNTSLQVAKPSTLKKVMITFCIFTLLTGGILSLFASHYPDGLEWSTNNVTGAQELKATDAAHEKAGQMQEKTAVMPDYSFKNQNEKSDSNLGTATAGIFGGIITFALTASTGAVIAFFKKRKRNKHAS